MGICFGLRVWGKTDVKSYIEKDTLMPLFQAKSKTDRGSRTDGPHLSASSRQPALYCRMSKRAADFGPTEWQALVTHG